MQAQTGDSCSVALGRDGRNYDMEKQPDLRSSTLPGIISNSWPKSSFPMNRQAARSASTVTRRFAYVVTTARQSQSARLVTRSACQPPFGISRFVEFADGRLEGVAVHDRSGKLFVSDSANKRIWVVDKKSFSVQGSISLETRNCAPGILLLPSGGDVLYALTPSTRSLWCGETRRRRKRR